MTLVLPPRFSAVTPPALAYDDYGKAGPTLVMLHGIPGSRKTFAVVGERLGRSCRVVVPDLLGFGESPDAPAHYHAAEHADVVVHFLGQLGVEKFHLVGFDFGGPTAIRVAGKLGGRIQSLTLAATNIFPTDAAGTKERAFLGLTAIPALCDQAIMEIDWGLVISP